jgi:hypothetical protein
MEDCGGGFMAATAYGGLLRQIHGGEVIWRTPATDPWWQRHIKDCHDGSMAATTAGARRRRIDESTTKQREKWSRGRGQQLGAGDRVAASTCGPWREEEEIGTEGRSRRRGGAVRCRQAQKRRRLISRRTERRDGYEGRGAADRG